MPISNDNSAEITAELDILSINLRREFGRIMPLHRTSGDIVRLAIVNDVSSRFALDIKELSFFLDKSVAYIKRRVTVLEQRGWIRCDKVSNKIIIGDLFSVEGLSDIEDLKFLMNQTRDSLEEMLAPSEFNGLALA
jgi:hypothetical protein